MLPNLIVIGAAKAATTSLHSYLDQHPEITMAWPHATGSRAGAGGNEADPKEMRFFWRDDWREQMAWYESHFDVATPVRGEATPAYSQHPYHPDVAPRIHSVVPDARLIYLVRDPIDRLVAHYVQQRVDGDRRSFAERMAEMDQPGNPLVCSSRYAMQLDQYLGAGFDASQILVVDQSELQHDRAGTLREVFAFLGVDEAFWSDAFESQRNTREEKRELTAVGAPLFQRVVDPVGRRALPRRWPALRPAARRALSRPIRERPVVEGETRARLEAILRPDVERLRELTGKRFSSWSL